MEDFSLDDYIVKRGLNVGSKPGVRARIGFKQQVTAATKPSAVTFQTNFASHGARQGFGNRLGFKQQTPFTKPTKTFDGVQLKFNPLGQPAKPGFKQMFDARHKLSTGKQLTTMPDARQKLLQKSKFSDARQRLDMKKQQQQKESATDMRMKILAKRRLNSTTGSAASQQSLVPESVRVTVPGQGLLGTAPRLQETGSVQGRLIGQTGKPIVVATGRGQIAIRPAPSAGTVTVIGGSLKKTIPAAAPVLQSSSSTNQLSQFTADKLRITARNEHALLNRRPLTANMSSVSAGASAFQSNTLRAPTNVAAAAQNIETIISSRLERTASAAEAAAAKVAVQAAAAAAAIRPTANRTTDTTDNTAQGESAGSDVTSPLQGFRTLITNLQTSVSLDDIMELFGDIGAMKNARIVKPGLADVVFVNQCDAVTAFKTYNMRELDGRPMSIQLMFEPEPFSVLSKPSVYIELDIDVMQRALFKSVADASPRIPVNFTVQL